MNLISIIIQIETIMAEFRLNYYFKEALENWGRNDLTFFKKQNARQKVLSYIQKNWQQNEDGKLMIAYQTKEENGNMKMFW